MTDEEIIKGRLFLCEMYVADGSDGIDALRRVLEKNARLTAELARKDAALREAIDLRIKLYCHSDPEGETDHLLDAQIAQRDPYARKWVAALGEREKEKNNG